MEKRDFFVPALGSDLNGESLSSQAKLNPRGWLANQGVQLNLCPVDFLLYKHQIPSSCWCHFVPVYAAPGEGGVGHPSETQVRPGTTELFLSRSVSSAALCKSAGLFTAAPETRVPAHRSSLPSSEGAKLTLWVCSGSLCPVLSS